MSNGLTLDEKLDVLEELSQSAGSHSPLRGAIWQAAVDIGWAWECPSCGDATTSVDQQHCELCEERRPCVDCGEAVDEQQGDLCGECLRDRDPRDPRQDEDEDHPMRG